MLRRLRAALRNGSALSRRATANAAADGSILHADKGQSRTLNAISNRSIASPTNARKRRAVAINALSGRGRGGGDLVEGGLQIGSDGGLRRDDDNRDQSDDQTILNGGGAGFIFCKPLNQTADSDDAARLFRDHAARYSGLIPPPRWALIDGFDLSLLAGVGQVCWRVLGRRSDSPARSMRWALWTSRSRMASA